MIRERQHLISNDLTGFMALAGDHNNIASAEISDSSLDSLPPVADFPNRAFISLGCPGQYGGANCPGLLAARIIVRHDDDVGLGRGDGSHQRTFARIAVATAPEHTNHTAPGHGSYRIERRGQSLWLVRVINNH